MTLRKQRFTLYMYMLETIRQRVDSISHMVLWWTDNLSVTKFLIAEVTAAGWLLNGLSSAFRLKQSDWRGFELGAVSDTLPTERIQPRAPFVRHIGQKYVILVCYPSWRLSLTLTNICGSYCLANNTHWYLVLADLRKQLIIHHFFLLCGNDTDHWQLRIDLSDQTLQSDQT